MIKVNKPKIRFNEFENIWTKSKLGELYEIYSGNTPSRSDSRNYQNGEIPWIKITDLNNSIICSNEEKISVYGATKLKVLPEKSVLIAMYGGFNQIGRTGLLAYPATINQALAALMPINEINPNFLLNFLNFKKESWRNVAASSRKDPNITKNDVEKFIISFPSLEEQSAIGSLFRTLDDLLASYKDNLTNYQSIKVTMLSKMFPKAGQRVPEIRLDGFEGEWEVVPLSDICQKVTEKNKDNNFNETFTNSAEFGIISQRDFFEKDISNEKSLNAYYVVRNNDFVYNPRISNYAPVGPVKRNKLGRTGVMSPLYFVFRITNSNIDLNFLETFFNTNTWHKFMKLNGDSGARADRFAIKDSTFLTMPIAFPSLPEQQAIGAYFSNLDNLINSHQEKITQLETLKKKLLQDMFI